MVVVISSREMGQGDPALGTLLMKGFIYALTQQDVLPETILLYNGGAFLSCEGSDNLEDLKTLEAQGVEILTCFAEAKAVLEAGAIPMMMDETCEILKEVRPWALVDAILAKKNLGTNRNMADKTIGLGPGFAAGEDVDLVIETMRGHNLGRIISRGTALPNTGTPGLIGGAGKERVIHSPAMGILFGKVRIGDRVEKGQPVAVIVTGQGEVVVEASLTGLVRGLIRDGYPVAKGFKIADIDPRESEYENCFTISDKARAIGGSVLEALLYLEQKQGF